MESEDCGPNLQAPCEPTATRNERWRVLAATPGIILLYSMGPALVFQTGDWSWSMLWTGCAIALLGLTVYRYYQASQEAIGSPSLSRLVSASSITLIVLGAAVLALNEIDVEHTLDAFLPFMTLGLVQGTITAIEGNRLVGKGVNNTRLLSIFTCIPCYIASVWFTVLLIIMRYGSS